MVADKKLGSRLFPFNPDRVPADTPKPSTEFTAPKADKAREGSYPQYEALSTPVTPVSAEALTSLLNMIKQVSDDETSREHKERLQQKVATAAEIYLAKNALLEDRNQFLTRINDEGKVCRSTKSETLGKARVMSFEDLEKARAEGVVKRPRKRLKRLQERPRRARKRSRILPLQWEGNVVGSVRVGKEVRQNWRPSWCGQAKRSLRMKLRCNRGEPQWRWCGSENGTLAQGMELESIRGRLVRVPRPLIVCLISS